MFILLSDAMLNKANDKAKLVKPNVRMIVFGKYEVKGSAGNWYQVTIRTDKISSYLVVDCNCDGGENGNVCYHASNAIKMHKAVSNALESVRN